MSTAEYMRLSKTGGFEKVATAQQTRHDLRLKWSTWLHELRLAAYQLLNVACDQKALFLLAEPQQVVTVITVTLITVTVIITVVIVINACMQLQCGVV